MGKSADSMVGIAMFYRGMDGAKPQLSWPAARKAASGSLRALYLAG